MPMARMYREPMKKAALLMGEFGPCSWCTPELRVMPMRPCRA